MDYDGESDSQSDDRSNDFEGELDFDNEDSQPAKKKRKTNNYGARNFFIDAEVEESDESDGEEEDGDKTGEYTKSTTDYSSIREDYRRRGPSMAELTSEQLIQAAKRFERYDEEDYQEEELNQAAYERRAPTVKDPRIWKVACRKPGEERRVVAAIMARFNNKALLRQPLPTYSAFCMDHVKGYIFVEARHSDDVKTAVEGIVPFSSRLPFSSKPEPIKVKDMTAVLRIPKSVISLDKGSWVRVKRGIYKGDLAYVYRVDDNESKAWVKLIPRLNLTPIGEEEKTGKRKRAPRPPARFFNKNEVINAGYEMDLQQNLRDATLGETFDLYKKEKYKDGFLYRAIPITSLDSNNITPSLDEIKKFQGQNADDSQGNNINSLTSMLAHTKAQKKYNFIPGDTVEVISGDMKSLTGVVKDVKEDTVNIIPIDIEYNAVIAVDSFRLRKFFKKGDHVKVLAGRYKGESGLIVDIDSDIVTIYSNASRETLKVLIHDIQECASSSTNRVQLKKYTLHDLVSVGQHSAGVIVKVNADSFAILETSGQVKRVPLSEMGSKRRSTVTFDQNNNQITARDEVTVISGPLKGREGTVKYVYKNHLFIQARGLSENGGIFVVRSNAVVASGKIIVHNHENSVPSSPFHGNNRSQQSKRNNFNNRGGPRGRRDPNINKKVKITKGAYRGYDALIRECNDATYRVELTSKNKVVSVPKEHVILPKMDESASRYDHLRGGKTPMIGMGDKTPMIGDRTPMAGDRTPARDHTSYGSDYTSDYSTNIDRREQPSYSVETPSLDPVTSPYSQIGTPNVSNYPNTPGIFSVDTPAYGQTTESPYNTVTPQAYPSTPATPGIMNPQTPGFTESYYDNDIDTLPTNIEIRFKDNYSGGSSNTGVIIESGSTTKVRLNTGQTIFVSATNLEPIVPQKNDTVKVINGEHKNLIGTLKSIIGDDAVVICSSDYVTFKLNQLGKYVA